MGPNNLSKILNQFTRCFDEQTLNALGKATGLCRREREATPYRLMLGLLQAFAGERVNTIADLQRTFNALSEKTVQYKPFHNQLAKDAFPVFAQAVLSRLFKELACELLRFDPHSPFARFRAIRLQDGTSFALADGLAEAFPGRFTAFCPAAVELHVDLDLYSGVPNRVVLAPDHLPERPFLPEAREVTGQLLLADCGYFSSDYVQSLEAADASFIIRGRPTLKARVVQAFDASGRELPEWIGKPFNQLQKQPDFRRHDQVDLTLRLRTRQGPFDCRLIVHPNLRPDAALRCLFTNLPRDTFTPEHISDAYRLRWQIELIFKEWKSHTNLHAFATTNPNIAQGLIWASLCAAVLARFCAQAAEVVAKVPISTLRVARCVHHVLSDLLDAFMHRPSTLRRCFQRAIQFLAAHAQRAHPKRDQRTGRLKLGLRHVHVHA